MSRHVKRDGTTVVKDRTGKIIDNESAARRNAGITDTDALGPDWGVVNARENMRTPWGNADYFSPLGPGAIQVSTPGHGGVKLSPERNKAIPPALRNSNGWYEEDVDVNVVGMYHPDLFPNVPREEFESTVRNWMPDQYEKATGSTLSLGDSIKRDEAIWKERNADKWQVVGAQQSDENPGFIKATLNHVATANTQGAEKRVILVTKEDLSAHRNNALGKFDGAALFDNIDGFEDITPPPPPPKQRFHGVDTSGLTDKQKELVERDLRQRWRTRDDTRVRSLERIIEEDGLTEKTVMVENGQRRFYLVSGEGAYRVSKGTWKAVEAPDRRSESSRISDELSVARHRLGKQMENYDFEGERRTKAKMEKLRQRFHDALKAEQE